VDGVDWERALTQAKSVQSHSSTLIGSDKAKMDQLDFLKKIGQEVVGASDRRLLWLEVMRAINSSLPPIDENLPIGRIPLYKELPIDQRKDLKVEHVETQFFPDLSVWFSDEVKTKWLQLNSSVVAAGGAAPATGAPAAGAPATSAPAAPAAPAAPVAAPAGDAGAASMPGYGMEGGYGAAQAAPSTDVSMINVAGPTGPGWVIEIKGHHFYNNPKNAADRRKAGAFHVVNTLIHNLENGFVDLPLGPGQGMKRFTMKELGISHAILARDPPFRDKFPIPNPNYTPPVGVQGNYGAEGGSGLSGIGIGGVGPGAGSVPGQANALPKVDPDNPDYFFVKRYDFVVQFVWVETPLSVRLEKELAAAKLAAEAAANATPAATDPAAATPPAATPPSTVPSSATAVPPAATAPPATAPPATAPPATAPPATAPPATAPPATAPPATAPPATAPPATAPPAGAPPADPTAAPAAAPMPAAGVSPANPVAPPTVPDPNGDVPAAPSPAVPVAPPAGLPMPPAGASATETTVPTPAPAASGAATGPSAAPASPPVIPPIPDVPM
jgi:type IV pilus assembly protein PilM